MLENPAATSHPAPTRFKRRAFFLLLPSAATISASQVILPVIAALLARTDAAENAISGFAVAFSIALFCGLPQIRVQQLTLVFLVESSALAGIRKFVSQWAAISTGLIVVVALTPLSGLVLSGLFSLDQDVERQAESALRALIPLPGLLVMRSHLHGVAMRAEKPLIVWAGTLTGSAIVIGLAVGLIATEFTTGAGGAALAFSVGSAVEVALLFILTRNLVIVAGEKSIADVSYPAMVAFFWPLLVSAFIPSVTQPVINAGMARAVDPTVSIAAVAVALGIFQTVSAGTNGVQAATLALLAIGFPQRQVLRFMLAIGALTTVATVSIGFVPPITELVFRDMLGAEDRLYDLALFSFRAVLFLPVAMVFEQFYASRLMRSRDTRPLVYINLIRLATLIIWMLVTLNLTSFTGAAVGAGAITATLVVEAVATYFFTLFRKSLARDSA